MTMLSKCEPHVDTVSLLKLACQLLSQEPRWISRSLNVLFKAETAVGLLYFISPSTLCFISLWTPEFGIPALPPTSPL